jgi:hypothetical protein
MAFAPDSAHVLTWSEDGSLRLWDMASAKHLHLVGTHPGVINALAVSPDGRRALLGCDDWTMRLWDLDGQKEPTSFTGHTGAVQAVAFSPDGLQAASGSADYTVRLWRLPPPPPPKPGPKTTPDGFVSLFNGKDLTGWKVYPRGTGDWKVEGGKLVGNGLESYLFSERGDYKNFHFRIEAKINDHGKSGQFFRSAFGPGLPKGYHAQINATHRDLIRTGSLYPSFAKLSIAEWDQVVVRKPLHKPDEWFVQEVIAQDNSIVIKVNGKTTVQYVDPKQTYREGHFALQQYGPTTRVTFRKIEVKELP